MTSVQAEFELEKVAKSHVVGFLTDRGPSELSDLDSSGANSTPSIPPYTVRRAVWSLVSDGAAEFTPDYKIRLR